jgi:hypothetical protein
LCLVVGGAMPAAYLDSYADSYASLDVPGAGATVTAPRVSWQAAVCMASLDRGVGAPFGSA